LAGLTKQGINEYVENLKHNIEKAHTWHDLARSRHGEFLRMQLEKELEVWVGMYSQIDAGSPAATNLLSFVQGIEMVVKRLVTQLKEKGKQAELDQKELDQISEFLALNKNQINGHTLLPTGYVKKGVKK
jgi:hypothetical protein